MIIKYTWLRSGSWVYGIPVQKDLQFKVLIGIPKSSETKYLYSESKTDKIMKFFKGCLIGLMYSAIFIAAACAAVYYLFFAPINCHA
jgi:hypothetical protein